MPRGGESGEAQAQPGELRPDGSNEMTISVTMRGRGDVTFTFGAAPGIPPAVQAALRETMLQRMQGFPGQAAAEEATGESESAPSLPQPLPPPPHQQRNGSGPSPGLESMLRALPPGVVSATRSTRAGRGSGGGNSAGESAAGRDQPDPTPQEGQEGPNERIQRLSGAIAGSIMQDLLGGAFRMGGGDNWAPPASEEAIAKLVRKPQHTDGSQCPVCLMEFEECPECDQTLTMPCGHVFHEQCLTKWLRSHNTCPVCRHTIEPTSVPRPPPSLARMIQSWRAENQNGAAGDSEATAADASTGYLGSLAQALGANAGGQHGQVHVFHAALGPMTQGTAAAAPAPAGRPTASDSAEMTTSINSSINSSSMITEESGLRHLTVSEMRERLTALSVDHSRARGRQALLALLRQHSQQQAAAPEAAAPEAAATEAAAPESSQSGPLNVQVHMQMLPMSTFQDFMRQQLQSPDGVASPGPSAAPDQPPEGIQQDPQAVLRRLLAGFPHRAQEGSREPSRTRERSPRGRGRQASAQASVPPTTRRSSLSSAANSFAASLASFMFRDSAATSSNEAAPSPAAPEVPVTLARGSLARGSLAQEPSSRSGRHPQQLRRSTRAHGTQRDAGNESNEAALADPSPSSSQAPSAASSRRSGRNKSQPVAEDKKRPTRAGKQRDTAGAAASSSEPSPRSNKRRKRQ